MPPVPHQRRSRIAKPDLKRLNEAYKESQVVARKAQATAARAEARERAGKPITIVLDTARFRNAKAIAQVHVDAWRQGYRFILPEKILRALTYQRFELRWDELLAAAPETGIFTLLAIEPEMGVVGFLRAGPADGDDPPRPFEIYSVNVAPRFQRKGIGRRLLAEAAARLEAEEGADSVFTWVLEENRPARWLFKKLGGRPDRRGEDRIGPVVAPKIAYVFDALDLLIGSDHEPQTFTPAEHPPVRAVAPLDPQIPEDDAGAEPGLLEGSEP